MGIRTPIKGLEDLGPSVERPGHIRYSHCDSNADYVFRRDRHFPYTMGVKLNHHLCPPPVRKKYLGYKLPRPHGSREVVEYCGDVGGRTLVLQWSNKKLYTCFGFWLSISLNPRPETESFLSIPLITAPSTWLCSNCC